MQEEIKFRDEEYKRKYGDSKNVSAAQSGASDYKINKFATERKNLSKLMKPNNESNSAKKSGTYGVGRKPQGVINNH